jgi:hypothetical protein
VTTAPAPGPAATETAPTRAPDATASAAHDAAPPWHDPQHGLEPTLEAYIDHLLGVFDQLTRVLRPEGTCWLNLGDTYSTAAGGTGQRPARRHRRPHQKACRPAFPGPDSVESKIIDQTAFTSGRSGAAGRRSGKALE